MKKILFLLVSALLIASCGGSKNGDTTSNNDQNSQYVDVTEQQKPRLIVIPSDQLLQKFGKLKAENAQGKTVYTRDFAGYLLKDPDSKFIIATIQSAFIEFGFPLNDLEQTLKSINDQQMIDEVDNIQMDAKTMLLTTAKPDIILELDYGLNTVPNDRNLNKTLTYTLRAIDAFSNKVVATIQQTGFGKEIKDNSPAVLMKAALDEDAKSYTTQLSKYFNEIIQKGRDITVRVTIDGSANLTMSDECLDNDTYTDFIIDYMKKNTVKGAYNMARNTNSELYFTNVRIKTLNDDGTQFSAYDYARALSKALNKGCGIKATNVTQGLGDAAIIIKGM